MKKHPHIPFYTGDWLKDPAVSISRPATRGIWFDLLCVMHECDRSGELRGTSDQLARLARCTPVELQEALTEIQTLHVAEVEYRNGIWTIANRRMRKEALLREKRAQAGSMGGNKTQALREQTPDNDNDNDGDGLARVREFARGKGIREGDADWFYWKGRGNGWTNGGKPILDWKATLLSWHRANYLPSQKQPVVGRRGFAGEKPRERPSHSDFNKIVRAEEPQQRQEESTSEPVDVKSVMENFLSQMNRKSQ